MGAVQQHASNSGTIAPLPNSPSAPPADLDGHSECSAASAANRAATSAAGASASFALSAAVFASLSAPLIRMWLAERARAAGQHQLHDDDHHKEAEHVPHADGLDDGPVGDRREPVWQDGGRAARRHRDELDLEDQRRIRRDLAARAAATVRQIGRDGEPPLLALLHQLQGLGPAADDLVRRKRGRPPKAAARRVEDGAVEQFALVVDVAAVRRPRRDGERVGRLREHLVLQAGRIVITPSRCEFSSRYLVPAASVAAARVATAAKTAARRSERGARLAASAISSADPRAARCTRFGIRRSQICAASAVPYDDAPRSRARAAGAASAEVTTITVSGGSFNFPYYEFDGVAHRPELEVREDLRVCGRRRLVEPPVPPSGRATVPSLACPSTITVGDDGVEYVCQIHSEHGQQL